MDESGATTDMTRRYARNFSGERIGDAVPQGHWTVTTMISALRGDGHTADMLLDGPVDGESFLFYVEVVLVPFVRPGDVVVMDNLASHKRRAVIEALEGAGARVLFLPPYSPDLNPIEKMWAKVKEFLRAAKARTQDALWRAIGQALETVTPDDAAGWLRSCGYMQ